MNKEDKIRKFLIQEGFKSIHNDTWNNGDTRVYFDDIDVVVIRFTESKVILWKNRIDGNMPIDAITSLIFTMVRI